MKKRTPKRECYTMTSNEKQVILSLNLGIKTPKSDPIRKLDKICEELDYKELYKQYERRWRKFNPKTLFKILVYGFL